jgi:hypothetical protein
MTEATSEQYPARFVDRGSPSIANWRPLAQWILVIPHMIVAGVLQQVGSVVTFVSWFIIMFTGKLPEGVANLQCMIIRYVAVTHAYGVGLTEEYPPFVFDTVAADPGTYTLGVDITPELEDRNRVTVFFRIFLLIPAMFLVFIYGIVFFFTGTIAWFAVLFTGKYPAGLRRITVGLNDFVVRIMSYGWLLNDRFAPLNLT